MDVPYSTAVLARCSSTVPTLQPAEMRQPNEFKKGEEGREEAQRTTQKISDSLSEDFEWKRQLDTEANSIEEVKEAVATR